MFQKLIKPKTAEVFQLKSITGAIKVDLVNKGSIPMEHYYDSIDARY